MNQHSERSSFIRVSHWTLSGPGNDRRADGARLIAHCLAQLDSQEDAADYPPRLLVLMATVNFQPFEDLLAGIHEQLDARGLKVALIGGSVGGVIDGDEIHLEGAQLVCIASRCIDARVGIATNVVDPDPDQRAAAVQSLCRQLDLTSDDPNPDANRFLFCFLPGFQWTNGDTNYSAAEIQAEIRHSTKSRIPMFGGVTGDNFQRRQCWQFADRQVLTNDAVVALVNCDIRFGIAMSHGLEGTGEFVFPRELTDDCKGIKVLERQVGERTEPLSPSQLLKEYFQRKTTILLGGVIPDSEGDRTVLYPLEKGDGSISVNRLIKQNWPLEILQCKPEGIRRTVVEAATQAQDAALMDIFHLVATFVFPCANRHQIAPLIGLDPKLALREYQERYPGVPLVGGLVFGEIGLGAQGRSQLRNWYVSAMCLSDELAPHSVRRRGNQALAVAAPAMMAARNTDEVLEIALKALHDVGLSGAMVSLVYRDIHESKRSFVILAEKAIGDGWKRIVALTRRRERDRDILTQLVKKARKKLREQARTRHREPDLTWEYIRDARIDDLNDPTAVELGKIVSYYASVLTDSKGRVVGLMQVGLGDKSNEESLPPDLQTFLSAVSGQLATALSQVLRMNEAGLSELFDLATAMSLAEPSVTAAAQKFVKVISSLPPFSCSLIHVRMATEDREGRRGLALMAGFGKYFDIAQRNRSVVGLDDISPTVQSFIHCKRVVVNDTANDRLSRNAILQLQQTDPALCAVLGTEESYVNLPIIGAGDEQASGVIHFGSEQKWFFSESIVRSLSMLGQRLYFVLTHVAKIEEEKRKIAEIEFLSKTTPPLELQELKLALRNHASKIAAAAHAEVVSFYLWDHERKAYVLRGQHGWKDDAVGNATYCKGEGMTGGIAEEGSPTYIRDLNEWKRTRGQRPGKYEAEMFGSKTCPETRFEVLVIPFEFNRPLGILTLQNRIPKDQVETAFATRDLDLLHKVGQDIASYVFAMQAHDESVSHVRRESRSRELASKLLQAPPDRATRIAQFCRHICLYHHVEACAVYIQDDATGTLVWGSGIGFNEALAPRKLELESEIGKVFKTGEWLQSPKSEMTTGDSGLASLQAALSTGKFQSLLVLPLHDHFGSDRKGVLVVANIEARQDHEYSWFTASDVAEFQRYARYLTRAIQADETAAAKLKDAKELQDQERRMAHNAVVLATLTHDLRNTIGAIQSEIRTITDTTIDPTARDHSDRAEKICETIARKVSQGLEAVGSSQLPEFQDVDLESVLQSSLLRIQDKAHSHHVIPEMNCPSGCTIRGVEFLLDEAFFNVIDNAVNALSERPTRQLRIDISKAISLGRVAITIHDSGRGIDPLEISKIMDGVVSRNNGERRASGLSLARHIFRQHGGEIEIKSEPGNGTTVVVSLPIHV